MPRKNEVKVSYQPAAKTPSKRKSYGFQTEMRQPQQLSPLKQYILDNEGSGMTVAELIEQFQEYDCEHRSWSQSSWSPSSVTYKCDDCGKLKVRTHG